MIKMKSLLMASAFAVMSMTAVSAGVTPGEPSTDFASSLEYAEEHGLPMAVIWGNTSCGYCNKLAEAVRQPAVTQWMAEHPILLVVKHEEYIAKPSQWKKDYRAAYDWIEALAEGDTKGNPHVGFYWKKPSGEVAVSLKFTGRDDTMPARKPKGDIAGQFAASLDMYFGEYQIAPQFACGDTELDRLEAVPSTSSLYVPVTPVSAEARLRVTSPSGAVRTYDVPAGAEEIRIEVPGGRIGQRATLELCDRAGKVVDTRHIAYVEERPCSVTFPKWVGERFDFGEWTMDYAVAKGKGGYVLALFTGTLWCPYCHGAETSLLADPKFTEWAKDNQVALVSFDQGNSSTPATAAGNGKARLLTWAAGESHIVTGECPSGAYYRSLKGISAAAAKRCIDQTTKFTQRWLAPGSTSARLGNPTFLLVKGDRVVGRLAAYREGYAYDTDENLARLDDLLLLADRDDDSSDYIQTTEDVLTLGETADVAFQVNSSTKCFVLGGNKTCYATFECGDAATDVRLDVVTADKTLASGVNRLVVRLSAQQFVQGVWLKATALYPTGKIGGSSAFAAQIVSSAETAGGDDEDGPGFDPEGRPCFGWSAYDKDVFRGYDSAMSFNVVNVEGAKAVTIKKVSGSLPSGLRLRYDKDTGRVTLTGKPQKTGTYEVAYSVRATIGGRTVTGLSSTFTFTVMDPEVLNPYLGKKYSNVVVPLYTALPGATPRLGATLTVSITSANRVKAVYAGTESKQLTFSGSLTGFDAATHAATMSVTAKEGPALDFALMPQGEIRATVSDLVGYSHFAEYDDDRLEGVQRLPGGESFADYVGSYTVTLPDADMEDPVGTGFLTLKLAKSAAKTGKVTWSGYLPDGTTVSGTSVLAPVDGNHASLIVFVRKGTTVLGVELLVRSGGAETWSSETEEGNEIIVARLAPGYVLYREDEDAELVEIDAYGGYLPTTYGPKAISNQFGLKTQMGVLIGEFSVSTVTATTSGFTFKKDFFTQLSYAKSSGVFSGKAKVKIGSTTYSGTVKGVLLVNWIACGCGDESIDRPYASGTFFGRGFSFPVDFLAEKAGE